MTRKPEVAGLVEALTGLWVGHGHGGYPTIDSFDYRESTRLTPRDDHPSLLFEQRTWKTLPEGEEVSHWETGLIRLSSDGTVRFNNAQPGRTEVMAGSWSGDDDGWSIHLESTSFAGDDRMLAATRSFELGHEQLHYRMAMHTTSTNELTAHLEATLQRQTVV